MLVRSPTDVPARTPRDDVRRIVETVSREYLRECVEAISFPRNCAAQPTQNERAREAIRARLASMGYANEEQGESANLVVLPPEARRANTILIGAHYDSVAQSPGADDNASAIAALLGCAKALAAHAPNIPVCFAAFNREEDGLLGSTEFVRRGLADCGLGVSHAHILEAVGYCRDEPGSQKLPQGLPIRIPDRGSFLGLLGNRYSKNAISSVLSVARTYLPGFDVLGVKVLLGAERHFPVLLRSDHVPFWDAKIPTTLWTDTTEYRNPHYHRPTDAPDTLDYDFLRRVTQLLLACVLEGVGALDPA